MLNSMLSFFSIKEKASFFKFLSGLIFISLLFYLSTDTIAFLIDIYSKEGNQPEFSDSNIISKIFLIFAMIYVFFYTLLVNNEVYNIIALTIMSYSFFIYILLDSYQKTSINDISLKPIMKKGWLAFLFGLQGYLLLDFSGAIDFVKLLNIESFNQVIVISFSILLSIVSLFIYITLLTMKKRKVNLKEIFYLKETFIKNIKIFLILYLAFYFLTFFYKSLMSDALYNLNQMIIIPIILLSTYIGFKILTKGLNQIDDNFSLGEKAIDDNYIVNIKEILRSRSTSEEDLMRLKFQVVEVDYFFNSKQIEQVKDLSNYEEVVIVSNSMHIIYIFDKKGYVII